MTYRGDWTGIVEISEGFSLDLDRVCLMCPGDVEIRLRPKSFEVLRFLIENAGRIVVRDELMSAVWPALVVTDDSITQCISELRRAFGPDGRNFIRTVPKRGYLFSGLRVASSNIATSHGLEATKRFPLPQKPSIAVLPFNNMSGDTDYEYFSDGITEDILTALAHVPWLFVIARNSSFVFKGGAVDVREAGQQLGVRYILEGSVRKAGSQIRISSQLLEAATGGHIWAERYDRSLTDLFEIQDQITQSVVACIEPSLRRAEIERAKRGTPDDLDAYDLYLRALAHLNVLRPDSRANALHLINQALALRPDYAEAHGVAAWCCFAQSMFQGGIPGDQINVMLHHARTVQELQTRDATTLAYAAIALAFATRDYPSALQLINRALALNPSSIHAHGIGAIISVWAGKYDRAVELAERALRLSPLDPLNVMPLIAKAGARLMKSDYEEAYLISREALQIMPTHTPSILIGIVSLVRMGRVTEAKTVARRFMEYSPRFRIFRQMPVFEHFCAELAAAGLPE